MIKYFYYLYHKIKLNIKYQFFYLIIHKLNRKLYYINNHFSLIFSLFLINIKYIFLKFIISNSMLEILLIYKVKTLITYQILII